MQTAIRFPGFSRWFWVLFILIAIAKLAAIALIPLTGDEAYHWEWSRSLSPCYYDHPGLVAYCIRASTEVFGSNLIAVRLPAFLSALVIAACVGWFAWRLTQNMRVVEWTLVALAAIPLWQGFGLLITTDPPFAACFMLAVVCADLAITANKRKLWIAFGVFLGLCLTGKFIGFVLIPGLLGFMISKPQHRLSLVDPFFLAGLVIAGSLFAPVLVWNSQNEWATFLFHTVVRHDAASPGTYFVRFLTSQPMLLMPILWAGVLWFVWLALRKYREQEDSAQFLLWCSVPLLGVALIQSLRTEVGAHWPAVSYFCLVPLGVSAWLKSSAKATKWFHFGWATSALFLVMVHLALLFPEALIQANVGYSKEKSTTQLSAMFGWKELGGRLAQEMAKDPGNKPLLLNNNYAFAAIASFYTPGQPRVQQFGRPSPYGRMYQFWQSGEDWRGRDAIYFRERPLTDSTRRMLSGAFESITELPNEEVRVGGKVVRTWYLVRAKGFRSHPWQEYLQNPLKP